MISTVVVSAAGRGTRMKELTNDRPKHLIEVKGRPFISYLLDNLVKAGIDKIILVVGHRKDRFEEFLSNNDYPVLVVDQTKLFGKDYGTAVPIKAAQRLVGDKQFIAIAGDHLYGVNDLKKMMELNDGYTYVSATSVEQPHEYGCIQLGENGFIRSIIEKPENPPSNLINVSLYKFTSDIFEVISKLKKSPRDEYEITDAINLLAQKGQVKVKEVDKYYLDFGRPEDVKKMEKILDS